ncbi:MAG: hypothetical protein JRJ70_15820 [Deltaproteobacteria bacterium]|nr:hypothetical protein [Deltaproteobacteria bacterium]
MNEPIPGGHFFVARKIYRSKVWLKHPFYLKVWLWIIGNVSHTNHTKNGRKYKRGELITTYDEIIKGAAYYFNKQHIVPTLKQVRLILQWLEQEGMIVVEPIRSNDPTQRLTGADPRARTRAYLGIRIVVVNYDTYQDSKNYKGRDKGRPSVQLGHDNNNGTRMGKNIYAQNFLSFYEAYPNHKAKKKAFEAWQKLERVEDMNTLLPVLLEAIAKQKQARESAKANGELSGPIREYGLMGEDGRMRLKSRKGGTMQQDKDTVNISHYLTYDGPDQVVTSFELDDILKQSSEYALCVKSKMPTLDKLLEGFEIGELIAISGPRKSGKTLFAQSLTVNFLSIKSLCFSYELTLKQFLRTFPELPLFISPLKLKAYSLPWLKERILEALFKHGIGVVFIDHLHFLFDLVRAKN